MEAATAMEVDDDHSVSGNGNSQSPRPPPQQQEPLPTHRNQRRPKTSNLASQDLPAPLNANEQAQLQRSFALLNKSRATPTSTRSQPPNPYQTPQNQRVSLGHLPSDRRTVDQTLNHQPQSATHRRLAAAMGQLGNSQTQAQANLAELQEKQRRTSLQVEQAGRTFQNDHFGGEQKRDKENSAPPPRCNYLTEEDYKHRAKKNYDQVGRNTMRHVQRLDKESREQVELLV